ncbi:MAG: hypothetical protein R2764_24645 [Bacteroidales bacterium]
MDLTLPPLLQKATPIFLSTTPIIITLKAMIICSDKPVIFIEGFDITGTNLLLIYILHGETHNSGCQKGDTIVFL